MQNLKKNYKTKLINVLILLFILILGFIISFISCVPTGNMTNNISASFNFPNPFDPSCNGCDDKTTTIRNVFTNANSVNEVDVTIRIYDALDRLVWYYNQEGMSITSTDNPSTVDVVWSGVNNEGNIVSQGIYTAKTTIQIVGYEGDSTSGGDTLTSSINIAVK